MVTIMHYYELDSDYDRKRAVAHTPNRSLVSCMGTENFLNAAGA